MGGAPQKAGINGGPFRSSDPLGLLDRVLRTQYSTDMALPLGSRLFFLLLKKLGHSLFKNRIERWKYFLPLKEWAVQSKKVSIRLFAEDFSSHEKSLPFSQ